MKRANFASNAPAQSRLLSVVMILILILAVASAGALLLRGRDDSESVDPALGPDISEASSSASVTITPQAAPDPTPAQETLDEGDSGDDIPEPGMVIGIVPAGDAEAAAAAQLIQAMTAALEGSPFEEPVTVAEVSPLAVEVAETAQDRFVLLVTIETLDDGTLQITLSGLPTTPVLARLDASPALWESIVPEVLTLHIPGDDFSLIADLCVSLLSMSQGEVETSLSQIEPHLERLADDPDSLSPDEEGALLFTLSHVQAAQDDLLQAIESNQRALDLLPGESALLTNRGNLYLSLGDPITALDAYEAASAASPNLMSVLYNQTLAYLTLQNTSAALINAEQLALLEPDSAWNINLRGVVYHLRGNYEEAQDDFEQACTLMPEDATLLFNKALTLAQAGDYSQALLTFDQLVELFPDDPVFRYYFAAALDAAGVPENAERVLSDAIDLAPSYLDAYLERGRLRHENGDYWGALADVEQAQAIDPDNPDVAWLLGDILLGQDVFDEAEEAYTRALELGASAPEIYAGRGWARHQIGLLSAAIEDYMRALSLGYRDFDTRLRQGFAYLAIGEAERAQDAFNAALELNMERAEAYAGLAVSLEMQRESNDAVQQYQQALTLDARYEQVDALAELPLWTEQTLALAAQIIARMDADGGDD